MSHIHSFNLFTRLLGSILEGPEKALEPVIPQALPLLLNTVVNSSLEAHVRETTAWTIGRICLLHGRIVLTGFSLVMKALLRAVEDPSAKVASFGCFALHNLFDNLQDESTKPTGKISEGYQLTLTTLFNVAKRPDASQHNLSAAAYEAIAVLLSIAPKDCEPTIHQAVDYTAKVFLSTFDVSRSYIHTYHLICIIHIWMNVRGTDRIIRPLLPRW